jgi:hypothetical protein
MLKKLGYKDLVILNEVKYPLRDASSPSNFRRFFAMLRMTIAPGSLFPKLKQAYLLALTIIPAQRF